MIITWLISNLDIIGLGFNAIGTLILIFTQLPSSLTYVMRKKDGEEEFEWELPEEGSINQEELRKRYNKQMSFKRCFKTALIFICTGFILQGIYVFINKL